MAWIVLIVALERHLFAARFSYFYSSFLHWFLVHWFFVQIVLSLCTVDNVEAVNLTELPESTLRHSTTLVSKFSLLYCTALPLWGPYYAIFLLSVPELCKMYKIPVRLPTHHRWSFYRLNILPSRQGQRTEGKNVIAVLHGSAYTVVRVAQQVNGKWQFWGVRTL